MCWEKVSVRLSQNLYMHYPFLRNPYIGWLDQDKCFEKKEISCNETKNIIEFVDTAVDVIIVETFVDVIIVDI